eukprot:339333_1
MANVEFITVVYNNVTKKVCSNDSVDKHLLHALFRIDKTYYTVIGLETDDGLFVQITNANLNKLLSGKSCKIVIASNNYRNEDVKDEQKNDDNKENRNDIEFNDSTINGWNLPAEKTFVEQFYDRSGTNGEGAKNMLNNWMQKNQNVKIHRIWNQIVPSSKGNWNYWYYVAYTK